MFARDRTTFSGSIGDLSARSRHARPPNRRAAAPPARPWHSRADHYTRRRMLARIDHIGVAVEDLDEALKLYDAELDMALVHRETVESQGVEAVLLDVGEGHVELLRPLAPDTPVGKFLAKNGPGLHHVAYQPADIDA